MKSDNEFINEIWNKNDSYTNKTLDDKFYKVNIEKMSNNILRLNVVFSLFLVVFMFMGISFASNYIYNNIIQKASQKNTQGSINYNDYYGDFILQDGRYYKKIYTYKEYLDAKEKFGNIVQISENEFESNFILIILLESFSDSRTYINSINSTDNTLHIELKKYLENEDTDVNNNVLSVKIDKSLDRDNIRIEKNQQLDFPKSDSFIKINDLPLNYTREQAIEDGCFVISNGEVLSNDKRQLDDFVENTKNNNNDFIRIVLDFGNQGILIKDIEYKDRKYIICADASRMYQNNDNVIPNNNELNIEYGNEFIIRNLKDSNSGNYIGKEYKIKKLLEEGNPNMQKDINICIVK